MKVVIDIPSEEYWGCIRMVKRYGFKDGYMYLIANSIPFDEIKTDKDCRVCRHSAEKNGSNCYECVKGIKNNFEAEGAE